MTRCSFCATEARWSQSTTKGTLIYGSAHLAFCWIHMVRYYLWLA